MFNSLVVFDFETSGLDHVHDRPIEVAAIKVFDGVIVDEFTSLIKQPFSLSSKITEITGITDEMLRSGLDEIDVFRRLDLMMNDLDVVLVGHNIIFDLGFLSQAFKRYSFSEFISNDFFCTMTIARERHSFPHTLFSTAERYGVELKGAHRAINDVKATYEILKKMNDQESIEKYKNHLSYKKKYGKPKWYPDHSIFIAHD